MGLMINGSVISMQDRSLIVPAPRLSMENLPDFQQEMINTIESMDEYSKNRGTMGGFSTGYEQIDAALEGINSGLILIISTYHCSNRIL